MILQQSSVGSWKLYSNNAITQPLKDIAGQNFQSHHSPQLASLLLILYIRIAGRSVLPLTMPQENSNLPLLPTRNWLLFHWPCMNEQLSSIFITQIIIWFCFSSRWVEGQSKVEIQSRWKLRRWMTNNKKWWSSDKKPKSPDVSVFVVSEVHSRVHYFNATGSTTTLAIVVKSDGVFRGQWVTELH